MHTLISKYVLLLQREVGPTEVTLAVETLLRVSEQSCAFEEGANELQSELPNHKKQIKKACLGM